jgi:hypothetical protein
METDLSDPTLTLDSTSTIPLDRSCVIVRATLPAVVEALRPFTSGDAAIDVSGSLERGIGLDERLPAYSRGHRAVVYRPRGKPYVGIIREGEPGSVHDVPLARRLSRVLGAPAVALHVAARDVACELFHEGRSLESWLCLSGEMITSRSSFELDPSLVARDPYGRVLSVLAGYGLEDDRLSFEDFARGDVMLRRWDVTIARCFGFAQLAAWPAEAICPV